jgi:hypothetical protein
VRIERRVKEDHGRGATAVSIVQGLTDTGNGDRAVRDEGWGTGSGRSFDLIGYVRNRNTIVRERNICFYSYTREDDDEFESRVECGMKAGTRTGAVHGSWVVTKNGL